MSTLREKIQKNKALYTFLFSIFLIIFGAIGASIIQEDFGKVKINSVIIPTEDGQWVAADLFKPTTATKENPAPVVVVVPGFQRNKEALASISIELARRGLVVMTIDPYAQGASSSSHNSQVATNEGYGAIPMVQYIYNTPNMNYIDRDKIAVIGHSAGANAALRAAAFFGKEAIENGTKSKVHSIFMSGYVLTLRDNVLRNVRSNIGAGYALFDEGAFRNVDAVKKRKDLAEGKNIEKWNALGKFSDGDMRYAVESLRLVNSIYDKKNKVLEVEIGKQYGNPEENTLRVVYNERTLHATQPYDPVSLSSLLEFTDTALGLKHGMDPLDQTWYYKDLFNTISLVGAFLSLVPLTALLLQIPFFKDLVKPIPKALPKPSTGHAKLVFWLLFAFSASVAAFSFIPLARLTQKLFVLASSSKQTWFFPQRMNNAVMLWAVFNGTLGFIVFALTYKFSGKKNGITPEMWGVKTTAKELIKTILLALTVFTIFFTILGFVTMTLHVDYRFIFNSAKMFDARLLKIFLMYIPFFFIFYLSNSLRVNGSMRFEGVSEWKNILLCCFANTAGLIIIFLVQYAALALTGAVYWTDEWLYVNLLFGVIPVMFILPIFNRLFFKLTGRIYLGALITCMIFIMMMTANTVIYIPL